MPLTIRPLQVVPTSPTRDVPTTGVWSCATVLSMSELSSTFSFPTFSFSMFSRTSLCSYRLFSILFSLSFTPLSPTSFPLSPILSSSFVDPGFVISLGIGFHLEGNPALVLWCSSMLCPSRMLVRVEPFTCAFFSMSVPVGRVVELVAVTTVGRDRVAVDVAFLGDLAPSSFLSALSLGGVRLVVRWDSGAVRPTCIVEASSDSGRCL